MTEAISGGWMSSEALSPSFTFTVFTATRNRAHTLPRVYESLKAQTFRDFEWLIVDNESTDGTPDLVARWQEEAPFPVRYFYQANRGQQGSRNRAAAEARGELFLTLDSDDSLLANHPRALQGPLGLDPGGSATALLRGDRTHGRRARQQESGRPFHSIPPTRIPWRSDSSTRSRGRNSASSGPRSCASFPCRRSRGTRASCPTHLPGMPSLASTGPATSTMT